MATVEVDGHDIRYAEAGEGPPLLLLHGGIIDAGPVSWGDVIEPLSERFTVYAPDMLGYGDSDVPDVDYTIDRHVRTMAGFCDELGIESPSVCGLSLGGAVALGLALDTDVEVSHLVPTSCFGLGTELPRGTLSWALSRLPFLNRIAVALFRRSRGFTKASLAGIVHDTDGLSADCVDAVWEYARKPNACVAFRNFRKHEMTRDGYVTNFAPRLGELDVPTLFVHGRHDEVVPVELAERAAPRAPTAELTVLERCAHWPPREQPDRMVELLTEFCVGTDT
ncbi:alpha/beta fold hydrolase [Haloarchaeobius iranensis]|uniref:Pimeloyl-ACP methyl ester carboxylesterase n=1 Tax=Haloarchaeobius iranensis TaxID=996166 RepID=A0A1G9UBJ8_9EURY|nr:alpha/beta hydrolase [Haloarchaeobius iranensis]SDM57330.1 Pimeloyl-ACP methyl ester carboxylesterase [Haloarchaeobius iranensis]